MGFLTKQVGPLPAGAWMAVVGGGLAIGWYFSKGSAEAAKGGGTSQQVPLTDPGVGVGGGGLVYDPPTTVPTTGTAITTNELWGNQAINWLIGKGLDPGIANGAITKFLTGQNRSLKEQGMINMALLQFGTPPESVPVPDNPLPTIPVPTTPKPTQPRSWNFYRVVAGDTPGKIASKMGMSWWNIYWMNDKVGLRPDGTPGVLTNPYSVKPGMYLLIPTKESGLIQAPPKAKTGLPPRYYTAVRGDTLTTIATKFHIHVWNLYTANDIVGMRPDGTRGILRNFSVQPGQRLVVPYQ